MAPKLRGTRWILLIAVYLVTACTTLPENRVLEICPDCQPLILQRQSQWPLVAYLQPSGRHDAYKDLLHVYLEGDGNPWGRWRPKANPNSRLLTALNLMALDDQLSVYINRPCYGYTSPPPPCSPELWTSRRYAQEVVDNLNAGIDEVKEQLEVEKIVLFGHSGGGTLAMLLAHAREDVVAVVTLAANLDHEHWTEMLDYGPLEGSLNPAGLPPLPEQVMRWHYAAGKDRQVPAEVVKSAAEKDPHADYRFKPNFDHNCCWKEMWPDLLERLETKMRTQTGQATRSFQRVH